VREWTYNASQFHPQHWLGVICKLHATVVLPRQQPLIGWVSPRELFCSCPESNFITNSLPKVVATCRRVFPTFRWILRYPSSKQVPTQTLTHTYKQVNIQGLIDDVSFLRCGNTRLHSLDSYLLRSLGVPDTTLQDLMGRRGRGEVLKNRADSLGLFINSPILASATSRTNVICVSVTFRM
jgi:hypothetical protein